MQNLIEELRSHGVQHKGTDLGGLLQWAALHIESQDEALAEVREEFDAQERERLRLEMGLNDAIGAIEVSLSLARRHICPPIELGRDLVPHINLMGGPPAITPVARFFALCAPHRVFT